VVASSCFTDEARQLLVIVVPSAVICSVIVHASS
jgi:hypothetical protein